MTRGTLLTVGTTALNLAQLLRGQVAGAAHNYGLELPDQCREIQLQCDNGTIYIGEQQVSATDYMVRALTGLSVRLADSRSDSLNLSNFWLLGAGAGAKISVMFTTY